MRTVLYGGGDCHADQAIKGSSLNSWAMRLAARARVRKAKVALARKLAVVLHRMLVDGTTFASNKAATVSAKEDHLCRPWTWFQRSSRYHNIECAGMDGSSPTSTACSAS